MFLKNINTHHICPAHRGGFIEGWATEEILQFVIFDLFLTRNNSNLYSTIFD